MRGAGAIPIFRAQDDPTQLSRNEGVFRAVHTALQGGAAVGIFPEGLSHSEAALQPLKTGAARMLLGAREACGVEARLHPIGLSFTDKTRFRSHATVMIGGAVEWADLAGQHGGSDAEAVRQLTERIDQGLRQVTVNLESWTDARIVDVAEQVHRQRFEPDASEEQIVRRRIVTAQLRGSAREGGDAEAAALLLEVRRQARLLDRLGWRAGDLNGRLGAGAVLRWMKRNAFASALLAPVAILGAVFFYLPYRSPGLLADRTQQAHDVRATFQLLVGTVAMAVWLLLWAAIAWWAAGVAGAAAALLLIPLWGAATLFGRDRWSDAGHDVRRFFTLYMRRDVRVELAERQAALAEKLEQLRARLQPA